MKIIIMTFLLALLSTNIGCSHKQADLVSIMRDDRYALTAEELVDLKQKVRDGDLPSSIRIFQYYAYFRSGYSGELIKDRIRAENGEAFTEKLFQNLIDSEYFQRFKRIGD